MKKLAVIATSEGQVIRTTEAHTRDLALACAIIVADPFVQAWYGRKG